MSTFFSASAIAKAKSTVETTPASAPAEASSDTSDVTEPEGVDFVKQKGRIGVGACFGITGWPLCAKYFVSDKISVEVAGPVWGGGVSSFGLYTNFSYEGGAFYRGSFFDLSFQAGGGLDLAYVTSPFSGGSVWGGIHVTAGIQTIFKSLPIEAFWAYSPGFIMSYGESLTGSGKGVLFLPVLFGTVAGVRYYF